MIEFYKERILDEKENRKEKKKMIFSYSVYKHHVCLVDGSNDIWILRGISILITFELSIYNL